MRIKSLDIMGFKSFADGAKVRFGDGITGVVGPNGCGKSNIVDALRWCMGEMSAKHLRGRAMQDVIFAGSESRGPSGMAEVTVTFHNDGNVPPHYVDYAEIAVTRRLHRDGTSEYLINKAPARLRDITDLFLGTGVGTRAYSIIEQGRVGFIVSARPEDRRTLIEEVAGISKFKARKKAAERRMHATEQNLARVNDIITELERQLGSLRRQAKKAERYKRVKEQLRELDLHAASVEYLRLAAVETVQKREQAVLEQRLSDAQREIVADESNIEADRLGLLEEEQRLQHEQKAAADVDARLAALERDLTHWRQQREDAVQRAEQAASDVDDSKKRVGRIDAERRDLTNHVAELQKWVEEDQFRMERAGGGVDELQRAIKEMESELAGIRRDSLEVVHEAARQRTHAASLERQRIEIEDRLQTARQEQELLQGKRLEAQGSHDKLVAQRDTIQRDIEQWTRRRQSLAEQFEEVTSQANATEARILALKQQITQRRSRLDSLEEIARRFEGYGDGVRFLMSPENGGNDLSGIEGLVADIIEAKPEYEGAIESVLGEKLQYIIVESARAGASAIEYLKNSSGGRSGFIPMTPRPASMRKAPASQPGLVGSALGCVDVSDEYQQVAEYLLGDVMVVENLAAALRIWNANGHENILVTLDGEVLDPAGVLNGGSDDGAGLLAKRREIRELTALLIELEADLSLAQARHEEISQTRLQLEINIQQLEKDLRSAELELLTLHKDIEAATAELARFDERREVLGYELEQQTADLDSMAEELQTALDAARQAEEKQEQLSGRGETLTEQMNERVAELANRTETLTGIKVQRAAREEKLVSAKEALERLDGSQTDLETRINRDLAAINDGNALVVDLKQRIAQGEQLIEQMVEDARERHARLDEARAVYDARRESQAAVERVLREKRQAGELVKETLVQLRLDLQRLDLDRQRLCDQIATRHDVVLEQVVVDYHLLPLPGEEAQQEREQLERSLKNIGPINLTAIDECAEVETRHTFLAAQRDDLNGALESLKRAIQRINRTSRQRFREAFTAVNEMFQKIYPRLFRGGVARLELLEADDVLEAGVEIVAQPPGKKLQSVGLLSGGEKALTATALIFAMFLVKPSPFCVLDEVDAPLDEANVGRFNDMLREMSKISQFIVITHNKQTMSFMDRLYGITMEEPGRSKVVSVDLHQAGDAGDEAA